MNELINFKIENLDSLGQGVSKIDDKICFIPKTLPGESGIAQIVGSKKKVHFAKLTSFTNTSDQRIEPECIHFHNCGGCDYLHTNYEVEIENKLNSFKRLLNYSTFDFNPPKVFKADKRLKYRNRIQLHYDLKQNKIGYMEAKNKNIVEIKNCLIAHEQIQKELSSFLDSWRQKLPANSPSKGHVEIYYREKIYINWNKPYAAIGFSQINSNMNKTALDLWTDFYQNISKKDSVIDLFGGSGNLTQSFSSSKVKIYDVFSNIKLLKPHQSFIKMNLFKEHTIPDEKADILVIDPPRSGFKETKQWVESLNPEYIGYQSCFADSMIRDIGDLSSNYKIIDAFLVDFFPGTKHYESLIFLKKKP